MKTLFEKIWDQHVVKSVSENLDVLYIDRHYIHEVTSPQAFAGLNQRNQKVFRPDQTTATVDHNVPTKKSGFPIKDAMSKQQIETLEKNCREHNIECFEIGHENQGIVHVIGPELGLTLPGTTIVCGDSHTSTHGAFGAIAFGIGTTQVEQVLSAQSLLITRPKTMGIEVSGKMPDGVSAKDLALYIISMVGANGGSGYFIEFFGPAISTLSMEGRMTLCNMSIEMGSRGGMIAPDEKTYHYLKNTSLAPKNEEWEKAAKFWKTLPTENNAQFDKKITVDISALAPVLTYGTSPDQSIAITESINSDCDLQAELAYMGFKKGEKLLGKNVDHVFIGSCTNSRIEDLRIAASVLKGQKRDANTVVWIVPGSRKVIDQAKNEGLIDIFDSFGAEFREPGCSACLAMNDDKIPAGALCVSTSNRNFEGRQGKGARTILASPATAAAAAITGKITDPRQYL